ncbi:hypothetical protein SAMD00019534_085910 [Acytostelium subglobosum LB1]|uniref:hypothetical protein n=1 Tax=Acytostelium subglobosum LB1 TaxID=1410327 RepID=UPI000644A0A2|nr:hypothetical protein SAMD00019534_085910 [Acytostelium subglobosum LB1]GAM25416.1 hypothetical protein SAMD00019534_085910 [Acytostelium subglobosum LB1]|eukprot:XP_012751402.1 hypothetical protein SAMD00019534_085910 [Acytostelium subglobosum LB1]
MAQEHRAKIPINQQISHAKSTINKIINEIKQVNHIINNNSNIELTSDNNSNDNDDDSSEDITKFIESITSCTSIDEFTKSLLGAVNQDHNDQESPNDHELLSMISRHSKHMKIEPYDKEPKKLRVLADVKVLNGIKKQIESCFELIDEHELDGQIIAMGNNSSGFSSFSLETHKWTRITPILDRPINTTYLSLKYVRGNIYSFGGLGNPNVYSRFSLAERKLYHMDMPDGFAGSCLPTCYDGDHYIYIVGGIEVDPITRKEKARFDRVDRFNIDTGQFDHIGNLTFKPMIADTFFHNNLIHVVYPFGVYTFNVDSGETKEILKYTPLRHNMNCFDGVDNIYMMNNLSFSRFSLSTKQSVQLPLFEGIESGRNIVYVKSHDSIIYFGGTGKNHQYSISDNKWTLINDNDERAKHQSFEMDDNDDAVNRDALVVCLIS